MADETRMASMPGAMHGDDPEATRAEIEQTRRRMSTTIDELGDVLQRKKGQIQERLDVMAPVREHPLRTVGIVFGAGLVLGLLTGGGGEEEEEREPHLGRHRGADAHWRRRAEMWEGRARRLLHIAREQDEELEELRASHRPGRLRRALFEEEEEHDHAHRRFGARRHREHDHRHEHAFEHEDESRFEELRDTVTHAVSGLLSNAVRQFARAMTA